ncbi:MAG: leucine-rich repeat domain-containing protein [Paludibacteraceae bacterium]|nr:leucine-rich repeat domain-containing protein [Paludibacteraceae bacterium]
MKTINHFRSKFFALTLALMASVSIQAHDFSVDGIYYNILDGNNVEVTFKGSHVNQYVNEYINSINIPNEVTINNTTYTVTRVGDGAFYACRTLNSVTIPNSVTYIGDTAFYSCDDLTTVDIGNAVTRIGDGAFFRCSFLSSITIPNSVTRIGNRAFKYCYSMTSVNIGSSVTEIGEEAFDGCTILNSVTIPNSVINIGAMAFQGCKYMTSVVIGNNVVNIGNEAFRWCYSLTSVKCHNTTPPILGENIFEWGSLEMGPYELDTLYVPAESLNLYKEAEQWNLFNSILPIKETSYKSQWCDTWNVMMMNSSLDPDEQKTTYRYQLAQDTVVDGKTYTILNCSATAEPNTLNLDLGMVRFAEDKKVYANYGGTEYLVYDFSVQVGDILIVLTNAWGDDTQKCLVHDVSIDETSNRTVITLFVYDEYRGEFIKDDYSTIKWIEGIGSENGFFEGVEKFVDGGGAKHLLCAYQGDELKYTGDLYEEYGCGDNAEQSPKDLFPTLWGLQRTSCTKTIGEDEYGTVWGSRSYLMQETQTTTIDGKQYLLFGTNKTYDEYCSLWLREENNKILVYSAAQKKDLVLYDFTLNVGDLLPRLYVDEELSSIVDYYKYEADWEYTKPLFVTEVSTITLLDGKEYKKWTFDNGMEYVEGIGSFGTSYAWNDFYQLIANGPLYSDVFSQHLVCISKNGQLLYKMDEAEMEQLETECLCEYNAEQKPEDLFPTLWGLQRTTFYHYTDCSESASSLTVSNEIVTINDKPYLRFGDLFLREENNRVLIYSEAYDKDLVLYDWNLEVGDSVTLLAFDFGFYPEDAASVVDYRVIVDVDDNGDLVMDTIPTDKVVVDKISTITLLDGKEYKMWHLATGWAGGITYVEGIGIFGEGYFEGDYFGLIQIEELPACYYGDLLVCITRNGQLLYQMDDTEMERLGAECLCEYNDGPKKDNAKDGKIGGRPTPTQWNMLEMVVREMENNKTILQAETFSYTLEDNSRILNNKTYFDLARQSTRDTAITKSVVGALHFCEDEGNRVYFLCDGMEYLLYDFTAEPGDSIEIFAGINNYPQATTYTHVVTGKDTLENGACRMILEVVFPNQTDGTNLQKVWLAGLGSLDGIVHNSAQQLSNARSAETESSVMLCAWREDDCLYTTDHPEFDKVGCVYNLPTAVDDIQTPETQYQKIIHNGHLYILRNNKIYDVLGTPLTNH